MAGAVSASGQKMSPAEVAEKMSGTWKLNRELSPSLAAPARGRPGGPGRGGPAFLIGGGLAQRGGGGGGGMQSPSTAADLPPDVLAAQAAMRDLQQLAETITLKAAVDSIAVADPRGERTYTIDGKSTKLTVGAATIDVKTKWDKVAVRQEFSSPSTRLVRSWEIDEQGHLVIKSKIESLTMSSKEVKAVYDRQ
ncbi:MAG: hypothetical protein ABIX28_19100 [Vicinamibacterales bacterium]